MKLFRLISSRHCTSQCVFPLKTLVRDSSCVVAATGGKKCFSTYFLKKYPASFYFSFSKFHSAPCLQNNEELSVLQSKRFQRKRAQKCKDNLKGEMFSAVAYSSAEQYKMQDLARALENLGVYKCKSLPEDAGNVLHVSTTEGIKEKFSHIYFFSEGSVVFWNIPRTEQKKILNFLKSYETNSYAADFTNDEKEDLDYAYSDDETRFYDGSIILNSSTDTDLHIYTFSNSLALSVKLGVLEASLEKFSDSIGWVSEKMKRGEKIGMSRNEIFRKRGELFALRHVINLGSDLLDTPDFYWDRKDLEILYKQTCDYLDITKRTKAINERLSYCSELIDLLDNHKNDQHHVRLEWIIIALIMVEVIFECIHFLERFYH